MKDKKIVCVNCKEEFIFSADDQKFYAERGFSEPKRCKKCRDEAKAARNNGRSNQYGSYNRNNKAE